MTRLLPLAALLLSCASTPAVRVRGLDCRETPELCRGAPVHNDCVRAK